MADLICVKSYYDRPRAELAAGILEANGIDVIVSSEDCGGYAPHLGLTTGGVRLLVQKKDEQPARRLLEDSDS